MTRREWLWLVVLLAAVVVRLAVLPTYPLNDTTEARYAEIGRQMVVTGDWVTPRIETERPFWGKPPLSFWLTAISFSLFGLSELAARLPSLLLMLLTAWVVYDFARRTADREIGIAAAAIMMTTILGFVVAGAVMTDASLLLSTTLAMVAFWMAVVEQRRIWRYPFFVALGLGLLARRDQSSSRTASKSSREKCSSIHGSSSGWGASHTSDARPPIIPRQQPVTVRRLLRQASGHVATLATWRS